MNALADFLELRGSLADGPIGDGGIDVCHALSDALDAAIVELAGALPDGVAVLAAGGYGRREQCIHSDVDLTILHDEADTETLARRILYPLWDAGLKVGHAFRTLSESVATGKDNFETLTSQLSSRLVTGDRDLFDGFTAQLARTLARYPLSPELTRLERARRERHPYQLMAADLKNGRGGLRTFQGLDWERRRARLIGDVEAPAGEAELAAHNTLLSVRNALHAVSGRAHDAFTTEARDRAAAWLGHDTMALSHRLTDALALGDRLAEHRWSTAVDPAIPLSTPRNMFGRLRARTSPSGTVERAVAALAHPTTTEGEWSEPARQGLVRLLASGRRGRMAFNQLQRSGWVEREFPEWSPVVALPQLAPFHEHPADTHMWRAADEMTALLESEDPTIEAIVTEAGADDVLLLTAFLHDIGKGRGGDHSIVGAEVATEFMHRVGFGTASTKLVSEAIRHHLLLMQTATRGDLSDASVIDSVASRVGDSRSLQVLYLLTIADARATGPSMWSEWKGRLLTQLYHRTTERLTGLGSSAPPRAAAVADLAGSDLSAEAVEDHLTDLPDEYAEIMSASEIAWHMDSLEDLTDHTHLAVGSDQRVLAVGRDRRGFLLAVCRAFAAHGVGIRDARIFTRSDGIAIDTFDVHDDIHGGEVAPETWPKVAHTLEEIEASGLDVTGRVAMRASAYRPASEADTVVRLRPDLSTRDLAIEVRTHDRIGLLADVIEATYEEGLDLRLARIDTRGDEAIDVLYIDPGSAPTSDEARQAMCDRIRAHLQRTED